MLLSLKKFLKKKIAKFVVHSMVDSVCIYSNLSSFLKVQGTIFSYFHRIEHLIESKEFLLDPLADCKISIFGVGHKFKLESDEFLTS